MTMNLKRLRILLAALLLLILSGAIPWFLVRWLRTVRPETPAVLLLVPYWVAEITVILGFGKIRTDAPYLWKCIGGYGMSLFVCYIYALTAAVLLPVPLAVKGWVSLGLWVMLSGWGWHQAGSLKVVRYSIPLTREPLKLVLLSDVHLGAVGSEARLETIVARINEQIPDLVCISGDLFDNHYGSIRDPEKVARTLRSIRSKYGVYGCLGNHDAGESIGRMLALADAGGITLLHDAAVNVDGRLILCGRLDGTPHGGFGGMTRCGTEEFLAGLGEPRLPVAVMDHSPIHITEYDSRVQLILSGHTHNGQQFPANHLLKLMYKCVYGHYPGEDGPHQVVTSGAGTWGMPLRLGTNSEIVCIQLGKDGEQNHAPLL